MMKLTLRDVLEFLFLFALTAIFVYLAALWASIEPENIKHIRL